MQPQDAQDLQKIQEAQILHEAQTFQDLRKIQFNTPDARALVNKYSEARQNGINKGCGAGWEVRVEGTLVVFTLGAGEESGYPGEGYVKIIFDTLGKTFTISTNLEQKCPRLHDEAGIPLTDVTVPADCYCSWTTGYALNNIQHLELNNEMPLADMLKAVARSSDKEDVKSALFLSPPDMDDGDDDDACEIGFSTDEDTPEPPYITGPILASSFGPSTGEDSREPENKGPAF
jgi:hypothetical protein